MNIKHFFFFCFAFFLSLCLYSQNQVVMDEWYTYRTDDWDGYIHYVVNENEYYYEISTEAKIKTQEGELISYLINTTNEKDMFLTITSFSVKGQEDNMTFDFHGDVKRQNEKLTWKWFFKGEEDIKSTTYPTLDSFSAFFLLTKLDYSEIGKILEFNSMEISELHYKENHYFEYTGEEEVVIGKQKIKAKKIITNGDGIGESSFWLDENNNLIKASIDNYKDMVKCKKEDINFTVFTD